MLFTICTWGDLNARLFMHLSLFLICLVIRVFYYFYLLHRELRLFWTCQLTSIDSFFPNGVQLTDRHIYLNVSWLSFICLVDSGLNPVNNQLFIIGPMLSILRIKLASNTQFYLTCLAQLFINLHLWTYNYLAKCIPVKFVKT